MITAPNRQLVRRYLRYFFKMYCTERSENIPSGKWIKIDLQFQAIVFFKMTCICAALVDIRSRWVNKVLLPFKECTAALFANPLCCAVVRLMGTVCCKIIYPRAKFLFRLIQRNDGLPTTHTKPVSVRGKIQNLLQTGFGTSLTGVLRR